jgi:hypothetical protein
MPKKGDVHVVLNESGKWAVMVEGNDRASSTHSTQAAARQSGQQVARGNKSELLVHGRDGRIRERNTYGRDPRASKG